MHDLARRTITERFLLDACTVEDLGEGVEGTLNETTFAVTFDAPTVVYEGRCSIKAAASSRSDRDAFADLQVDELMLKLPALTLGLAIGQRVIITESADADLLDEEFEITRVEAGTHSVTRRVVVRRMAAFPSTGGPA